jgi:hypothetical protein
MAVDLPPPSVPKSHNQRDFRNGSSPCKNVLGLSVVRKRGFALTDFRIFGC